MTIRPLLFAAAMIVVSADAGQAQMLLLVNGAAPTAPLSVSAGSLVAVAVSGAPGNATDWIGFYPVAATDGAYLDWRYLNGATVAPASGLTDATVSFLTPVTPGDYEFRFFANNGYERLATSTRVTVTPSAAQITVNSTAPPTAVPVGAGTHLAVGVTNGPANAGDWIGLFATGASDGSYVAWQYLNGTMSAPATGASAASLTFAVPTSAGSYELRLFANSGYGRLATSTTVVVAASAAQLAVNNVASPAPVTVTAGSAGVVSVSSGPANATDWVALFPSGAPDTAYIDWRYLNDAAVAPATGVDTATLHFTMPTTAGTYEFRFFADNGYGRLAVSGIVTVPSTPATILVDGVSAPAAVSVLPGSTVSVAVAGGPGNTTDWVTLAASGAPDGAYLAWQYLSGTTTPPTQGLTGATLAFAIPSQAGSYEFRFFVNNGFTRLATSSSVVATSSPLVTIQLTNPFPGTAFILPSSIELQAATTVSNGSIAKVDFFAGATLVGTATTAPYHVSWSGISSGDYTLGAVATDNRGTAHFSSGVNISVLGTGQGNGVLGPPVASLPSGTYGPTHTVSLLAEATATIRYTTDGSTPTQSSAVYSAPIPLTGSISLKVRAFKQGWTPSSTTSATYTILSNPLVIAQKLQPAPNAAGWNHTPVTVTFVCTDDAPQVTCPDPITFSDEGANQTVSVSASDSLGNQAQAVVVVSIDKTPTAVSIPGPDDGATTTEPTVDIVGSVSDSLSGVASAACNGTAAALVNGSVQCSITLRKGINNIVLRATDAAGNSTSKALRVLQVGPPATLTVTPASQRLTVGESRIISASTEYGGVTGVTWTSSDSGVVEIASDGSGTVTGVAPGTATVTATLAGVSGSMTVTVVGVSLVPGDVRWTVSTSAGGPVGVLLAAHRVDDSGPDLFSISFDSSTTPQTATVVGLAADGRQVSREQTSSTTFSADVHGGLIGWSAGDRLVERLSGVTSTPPWQYQSPEDAAQALPPTQGLDGTIYIAETNSSASDIDVYIVGLDGTNGQVKFRTLLPSFDTHVVADSRCTAAYSIDWHDGRPRAMAVGADGALYVAIETGRTDLRYICDYPDNWYFDYDSGQWSSSPNVNIHLAVSSYTHLGQVRVVRLDSVGGITMTTGAIGQLALSGFMDTSFPTAAFPAVSATSDSTNGALINWRYFNEWGVAVNGGLAAVANSSLTPLSVAFPDGNHEVLLTGSSGTAYIQESDSNGDHVTLTAIDTTTGSRLWSGHGYAWPMLETADRHLVAVDYDYSSTTSSLLELSSDGGTVATIPLPFIQNPLVAIRGQGRIHAVDGASGDVLEVVSPDFVEASMFVLTGTLPSACEAQVPFSRSRRGMVQNKQYTYRVTDITASNWVPSQLTALATAFSDWSNAMDNMYGSLHVTFVPFVSTPSGPAEADIAITRADLPGSVLAQTKAPPDPDSGYSSFGMIEYTRTPTYLNSDTAYLKVTLHEIGHLMGLGDNQGTNGSTVMNQFDVSDSTLHKSANDQRGNIPIHVTACDLRRSLQAAVRPWP